MRYKFYTNVTMKPHNADKWWIMSDYVKPIEIAAGSIKEALTQFVNELSKKYYIQISKTALKNKQPMYIDDKAGNTKQVGYVITGSTDFQDDNSGKWVSQYIDIWTEIKEERDIEF